MKSSSNFSLLSALGMLLVGALVSAGFANQQSSCILWSLSVITMSSFRMEFVFLVDKFSLTFCSSVMFISSMIFIFSSSYMQNEPFFSRFHLLVLTFVGSMLLLIFSLNILSIILGWDGLGVSSYLLVIYYQSPKALNAGTLTALSNRVGDVFIMISCAMSSLQDSFNFSVTVNHSSSVWASIAPMLVLSAMTKSAQIPFSAWLPAAMAAPTPVSALVHSSTLVTAGVYLLFRFSPSLSSGHHMFIVWLGTTTMLMAGLAAMFELDSKKIVALSTLSQLGLMFSAIGVGASDIGYLHLLMHAYMKALLFISTGNLIHNSMSYQNIRFSHQDKLSMPVSSSFMVVSNMGLMGTPFLSGFFSKDLWLELSASSHMSSALVAIFYLSVALTVMYSLRMMMMVGVTGSLKMSSNILDDSSALTASAMGGMWGLVVISGKFCVSMLLKTPQLMAIAASVKLFTVDVILSSALMVSLTKCFPGKARSSKVLFNMWGMPLLSSALPSKFSNDLSKLINISLEGKSTFIQNYTISLISWSYLASSMTKMNLMQMTKLTMVMGLAILMM